MITPWAMPRGLTGLLISPSYPPTTVSSELRQLLRTYLYCLKCNHKVVYDPVVYGTETSDLEGLFRNGGDWLTLGFIDCYLHDYPESGVDDCVREVFNSGFAEKVAMRVMRAVRGLSAYGVRVRASRNHLFPTRDDYPVERWFYLIKGRKSLRCHLFIDDEPVGNAPEPEDDNRVSFEVNLVCL